MSLKFMTRCLVAGGIAALGWHSLMVELELHQKRAECRELRERYENGLQQFAFWRLRDGGVIGVWPGVARKVVNVDNPHDFFLRVPLVNSLNSTVGYLDLREEPGGFRELRFSLQGGGLLDVSSSRVARLAMQKFGVEGKVVLCWAGDETNVYWAVKCADGRVFWVNLLDDDENVVGLIH